ncbi:MAG: ABC transporter permease [Chloroflexi bacterium]|jgi:NitT/TauT family transport system permease protein|nr:ABC transporter permease [Chloroflexota bacterium]
MPANKSIKTPAASDGTIADQGGWGEWLLRQVWLWHLISYCIVFGIWEIAGRIPISLAFPTFSAMVMAFIEMISDGSFANAYVSTLPPLVIGVFFVSFGGVATGVLMGLSRGVEWTFLSLLVILQTAPVAAVIPLITYAYGIDMASKVVVVVIMAGPLVILNSYKGIRNANPALIQMCRSFQGNLWQEITKVILPQASGMIFAGLRLGVSAGFIGIVLAELLITPTGIGDLITYNRASALYAHMFAAIVSIIMFSTLTLTALQRLEHKLFRPEMGTINS